MKRLAILIFFSLIFDVALAQSYQLDTAQKMLNFKWPEGKRMAISLTFDDARLSQPDFGIPLLNQYDVKATFYLIPSGLIQRLEGWKKALQKGHDIGNHSLNHPCTGNFDWSRDNALENYTLSDLYKNLDSANNFIFQVLGVLPVSFAFPCGQKFIGRGSEVKSYVPVVSTMFETGRGWLDEAPNEPSYCDLAQLTGIELDGKSFKQVKKIIDDAKSKGKWLVFAGHEMNKKGIQTTKLATLKALCKYAKDPSNEIWIDHVHAVASYVKQVRNEDNAK